MKATVTAPAKINLTLDILGKRFDGYHNLSTIMQTVSLYDSVTVTRTDGSEIKVSCDYPGVPCDESNIVYKSAVKFFDYTKIAPSGLRIHIDKSIPTQAGLAGGSADGGAVIVALNKLFSANLNISQMMEIGEKIGADVPFCIMGGTCHAQETGTKLTKLKPMPKCYIVICKPEISVSTAVAYEKVDSLPKKEFEYTNEAIKSLYRRDIRMLCSCMYNDFEEALCLDEVNKIKLEMIKHKAKGACMSGSGSAVFGVFLTEKNAQKCFDELKKSYKDVFLCEPVKNGCTF